MNQIESVSSVSKQKKQKKQLTMLKRLGSSLLASSLLAYLVFAPSSTLPVLANNGDLPVHVQITPKDTAGFFKTTATARIKGLGGLGWKEIGYLSPQDTLQVQVQGNSLKLNLANSKENYQAIRLESPHSQNMIYADKAWYRGHLTLQASNGAYSVVNEVSLEQYLYSVVPSEMPASWPLEALKSQAVAARTYALTHLGQYRKKGYDLTSTTASQVYQGVKAENNNSNQAVNETAGIIMTYQNKPIHAYFHSTSGGRTENGADLWDAAPYLQAVDDVDHASPKYTWYETQSQAQVRQRLQEYKINVGEIVALQTASYTQGGRIKTLRIIGSKGEASINGEKARSALRLNSTFFNVGGVDSDGKLLKQANRDKKPVAFQFAGRGWGHGMGMSQYGARQLALNGYPYHQILGHYYRGIELERIQSGQYQLAMN